MKSTCNDLVFAFGKYKDEKVIDIINQYPSYCVWLLHQPDFPTKNSELFNFMIKNGINYDKDYNKKKQEFQQYKKEYFTFGKYKNKKIEDVFEKDEAYCRYIYKLENVEKYHENTVQKIKDLIESSS